MISYNTVQMNDSQNRSVIIQENVMEHGKYSYDKSQIFTNKQISALHKPQGVDIPWNK